MVPMMPGRDKLPWQLCSRCWIEGVQSQHMKPKEPKRKPLVSHEMGKALAQSGWKVTDATPAEEKRRRSRG